MAAAQKLVIRPSIGSRHVTQHVVRRDSLTGFYEELNCPLEGRFESEIQAALLRKPKTEKKSRLRGNLRAVFCHLLGRFR